MADNIIKLKVDSQEYEGKIKRASQGLQELGRNLREAGKTFADADAKQVEFARELGKMQTVSNTAKGKIAEMSAAFVNLKSQYLQMTDAEKQSPIGQAMSKSLEELKQRTIDAKRELEDLNKELNGVKAEGGGGGLFGGKGITDMLAVAGGNILSKGITALTSELTESVQQSIELARAGEGVRNAFERLNQHGLLDRLKEATHGTVSEVELMKQAIKFENFKLPLEDLATYLAFAQQKAKDTGESVDYMVNSITTGLGRQSKQILDNLGISAAELTRRMNEGADMTKAVADIIREEMAKAGDYVETAADRAARAAADAQNQMEALGRQAMPVAEEFAKAWNEIKMGGMSVINFALTPIADSIRSIRELLNEPFEIKFKADVPNLAEGSNIDENGNFIKRPSNGNWAGYDAANGRYYNEISSIPEISVTGTKPKEAKGGSKTQTLKIGFDINKAALAATKADESGTSDAFKAFAASMKEQTTTVDDLTEAFKALNKAEGVDPQSQKDGDNKNKRKSRAEKAKEYGENATVMGVSSDLTNGVNGILSGIEQMGIEIPEELKGIMSGIQGVMTILTSINTILGVIEGLQTVGVLPFFARGGIVPHAATGYIVPGNSFSGDNTPIMANAGEVVLTQAMAGNLASQLSGQGRGMNIVGEIQGEKIVLVANRFFKRTGQGEIVTW